MIEVILDSGKKYTFQDDISMEEIDAIGEEPKQDDSTAVKQLYNRKRLIAFSVSPKLTLESFKTMLGLEYAKLMKAVVLDYTLKMQNLLSPPKLKPKMA